MVVMAIRHLQAEPPRPPGQISYRHGHEPTPHFGENVPRGVTRTPPSAAVSDWMPSQKATQQLAGSLRPRSTCPLAAGVASRKKSASSQ